MTELLIAIAVVVFGSAFWSGSEAALFSISVVKVRQLAQDQVPGAQALLRIKENMSRPISTIVIMNNIFNIVGSIFVGIIAGSFLDDQGVGVVSGVLTLLVIIFAEIIPKTLGERYAERIALSIARLITFLTLVMSPLIWLIEHVVRPITGDKPRLTTNEAEIQLLAQIGRQEGTIERDEALLIERVFRLNDATAASLMTPRINITYLHGEQTLGDAQERIVESQHTRMLVIDKSVDDVVGIVRKDELLAAIVRGDLTQNVADLAHPARFIPEMVRADSLLEIFRATREHLAVVVDEFGGVSGVVTLEDVVEVLTGEILDETDTVEDPRKLLRRPLSIDGIPSPLVETPEPTPPNDEP